MATVNPLVAASVDKPADAWAGVWIAEDIELVAQGVRNGSWIDGTLGVTGASLDALALISDPVGALLQYGVAWIIEHVKPLSEALDWLAGDPGQIAAHAATWRNVAADLRRDADDLVREVRLGTAEWTGAASDTYRAWMGRRDHNLRALASGADAVAAITEGAGFLIAAVRILVRDAIAAVVSRLIVYAAEELASLGLATPLLIEQVTTLVAAWAAKIARWLRALIASLQRLADRCYELARLLLGGEVHSGGRGGPRRYEKLSFEELISDRGANVGRLGTSRKVREVRDVDELKDYFDALTRGGATDVTRPGFPGRIVRLQDGTIVTWRLKSKTTGDVPTVDVNPGNGFDFKVHVNPSGW
ncbi:MAG TPA: hypothetical protein VH502_03775 [Actinoplanes sp.]